MLLCVAVDVLFVCVWVAVFLLVRLCVWFVLLLLVCVISYAMLMCVLWGWACFGFDL